MLAQDTAAAQQVITQAAANPATIAAAKTLEAAIVAAVKTSRYGSSVPASITSAASSINVADLLQDPQVQGKCVTLIQASAVASGASWAGVAQVR